MWGTDNNHDEDDHGMGSKELRPFKPILTMDLLRTCIEHVAPWISCPRIDRAYHVLKSAFATVHAAENLRDQHHQIRNSTEMDGILLWIFIRKNTPLSQWTSKLKTMSNQRREVTLQIIQSQHTTQGYAILVNYCGGFRRAPIENHMPCPGIIDRRWLM